MEKVTLITGITGQDGSYLAELLLEKGYHVHGLARPETAKRLSVESSPIRQFLSQLTIHEAEITDRKALEKILRQVKPQELYHLAAQSHVGQSFQKEALTLQVNINSTYHLLRIFKDLNSGGRFYFAATSEMFGQASSESQNEFSPFNPVSPYAVSKLAGFYLTRMFRQAYKLFAVCGILFNHESPRRREDFVTRKISLSVAKIKLGLERELRLGSLDVKRDWGFSGDYVKAMWLMLQQPEPEDYVIGTGKTHSLKELLEIAFDHVGLNWEKYVIIDESLKRPAEIYELRADASKAEKKLGWRPQVSFEELIKMMVDADLARLSKKL